MSLPRQRIKFATGENLSPSRLNTAFEQMYKDLQTSMARRYTRFNFKLDWTGVTNASTAEEFVFRIKAPWAYRVEFIELFLYNATGTVTSVTLSTSLQQNQSLVVAPAGAAIRAMGSTVLAGAAAAATEITYTLTVAAPAGFTLGKCYAKVHCVADRGNSGLGFTTLTVGDAPRFAAGELVDANKLNTAFSAYEAAADQNTAATRDLRIVVFSQRAIPNPILASDQDMRLPADGNRIDSMDVVNLGAVGDNITGIVMKAGRVAVTSVTVNGSGTPPAKTQGTSVNHTQLNTTPTTVANDYFIQMTRAGAGTIPLAYVVVYCS